MRFLVIFRDKEATNEMVRLLESRDLSERVGMPLEMMISAVGFQCMNSALLDMGLKCRSCTKHRNSNVAFEFILVDDFFLNRFEEKLREAEALTGDMRFANSRFLHFNEEELSPLRQGQAADATDAAAVDADAAAAVRERLVLVDGRLKLCFCKDHCLLQEIVFPPLLFLARIIAFFNSSYFHHYFLWLMGEFSSLDYGISTSDLVQASFDLIGFEKTIKRP